MMRGGIECCICALWPVTTRPIDRVSHYGWWRHMIEPEEATVTHGGSTLCLAISISTIFDLMLLWI